MTGIPGWTDADVLRLVANTIKHGPGTSADELRQQRPDLFEYPRDPMEQINDRPLRVALRYPAFGDLFVTISDIDHWTNSLSEFWKKIGERFSKSHAALEF